MSSGGARGPGAHAAKTRRFHQPDPMLGTLVLIAVAPIVVGLYAYVGYPFVLWISAKFREHGSLASSETSWPMITVTVPVYNAEATIRTTLDRLLEVDYPRDRLQLLVISDGSTDATDDIVKEYESRGVELLRMPLRRGKTIAENSALAAARGDLIVNVDATILVPSTSLKPLIRVFDDSTIGVASGRDVSVGDIGNEGNGAESGYVGYEMWIRDLETRLGSIVGASGCFYAIRRYIHAHPLPADLSWDFASVLVARKLGLRSVSVADAVCIVPRTNRVGTELKRKIRTMARGIRTLLHYGSLMNPFTYGGFALMLISHKLLRWLPYLLAPFAVVAALGIIGLVFGPTGIGVALAMTTIAALVVRYQQLLTSKTPAALAFIIASTAAGSLAWWQVLRRTPTAMWDPTPRPKSAA